MGPFSRLYKAYLRSYKVGPLTGYVGYIGPICSCIGTLKGLYKALGPICSCVEPFTGLCEALYRAM